MDHGLAEIFGAGLPLLMSGNNLAARAVMVDDVRMIDGEIVDDAIGIVERIPATAHHVGNEAIGLDDGDSWIVHELRLHASPLGGDARLSPQR